MSDDVFLWVTFLLCLAVTILSFVGAYITSPVMLIFASVFGTATVLVGREIWERR